MMLRFLPLLAYLLPGLLASESPGDRLACAELGFSGLQLGSDCQRLYIATKDQELLEECKRCAAPEVQRAKVSKKYQKGQVRLGGPGFLQSFPHVQTFIEHKMKDEFTAVSAKYDGIYMPRVILFDSHPEEDDAHTVRIDHWHTQHIEAFFRENLVSTKAAPAEAGSGKKRLGGAKKKKAKEEGSEGGLGEEARAEL